MTTTDWDDLLREQVRRNHEVVEIMCEQMLVTPGDRGVLVIPKPNGTVEARLSDAVPFGEIHWQM